MKTILVAVDFSPISSMVLEQAASLAKSFSSKVWILHAASNEARGFVYEPLHLPAYALGSIALPGDVQLARDLCAEEFKREHAQLLEMSAALRSGGIDAQALLLEGDAAPLILEKAEDLHADLIVLGSHGHGLLHKALTRSVVEAVVRHAGCNVMIVPGRK